MTRPSLADFGTHDESAYPELWRGVVGAWCPSLGPTGNRLHDFSRRNNWGTLTNMDPATDWVVDRGQYALDFDGSSDCVNLGSQHDFTGAFSFSIWINLRSRTGYHIIFAKSDFGLQRREFLFYVSGGDLIPTDSLAFLIMNPNSFVNRIGRSLPNGNIPTNTLSHFCGTYDGSGVNDGLAIYIDGLKADTTNQGAGGFTGVVTQTTPLAIGTDFNRFPNLGNQANMVCYETTTWLRCLQPNEIKELYNLGRGGMYTRRTRRSFYIPVGFNASWARNSNVILGAGATC